jgi:RNA polymerase-binding protein DksA
VAQKRKKTSRKEVSSTRKKRNSLSNEDIASFRELLLIKRREIVGDVNEMQNEALKKSRLDAAGDLSSMPIHMADLGSDTFEQEFALGLMDSERKLLKAIDEALVRIQKGVYGVCEGTGKPILKARLQAKPWARYGVDYARKIEQGLVQEFEEEEVAD